MKVLVVDDSILFRTFMRSCIAGLPDMEIVGTASDGRQALEMMDTLQPDLITLDIEMPHVDGIEVLKRMQQNHRHIKVIIVSSSSNESADHTVQALNLGAFDFVMKPSATGEAEVKKLQKLLHYKISTARTIDEMLGHRPGAAAKATRVEQEKKVEPVKRSKLNMLDMGKMSHPDIVAIGSSTGGPAALQEVLKHLPASFPVPITITQHMPSLFVKSLADRLNASCPLHCSVAEEGEVLKGGHVYLAPGGIHMKIKSDGMKLVVQLEEGPRVNHSIPSVDVTYDSLALLSPRIKTLALVLTGMGNDGAAGAKRLKAKNSFVMIQDEETSVVWGMPGETFKMGAADVVLPLDEISSALMHHTARKGR